MTEYVDRVDADDRVLGVVARDEAIRHGLLHRVATTVCRHEDGRILVHRRPDDASRFPGCYDSSFGGAVRAGETYPQAAGRELAEEVGVRVPVRHLVRFLFRGEQSSYQVGVHAATLTAALAEQIAPDPRAVAWHGWLTDAELRRAWERWPFIPDGKLVYDLAADRW
jgi:8-oxo-dGTP pyrophosphatase MutT (NUDIX family)